MKIPFVKYHGAGNDFIMIDETQSVFSALTEEKIQLMCDRHFGIGADGLIRLRKTSNADFEMLYYNADGKIGSLCGNGGRCTVAFAAALGLIGQSTAFLASDGIHHAEIISELPLIVKLKMADVTSIEQIGNDYFVNTGSPHFIRICNDPDQEDVFNTGKSIRHDARFAPGGTNVNFVTVKEDQVVIRTFERGVENETLSCGTGIVASVLALVDGSKLANLSPVSVTAVGGKLKVYFKKNSPAHYSDIWLEGPAEAVFSGMF